MLQRETSILDYITQTVQQWLQEAISSDSELRDSQTTKVEVISIQKIKEESGVKSRLWIHTPHYSALQNFLMIQRAKQVSNEYFPTKEKRKKYIYIYIYSFFFFVSSLKFYKNNTKERSVLRFPIQFFNLSLS